jgi:hypothetical protein
MAVDFHAKPQMGVSCFYRPDGDPTTMISLRWLLPASVCALALQAALFAQDDAFKAPDSLVLKNGRTVRGLIIKNSRDEVLIQEEFEENSYPKSEIVRIRDEANIGTMFTDINRKGDLPAWRVIANDLRTHDEIRSLVEIPATVIDNGEFRNVPYKSFRVNNNVELNIYGDPDDPAGVEMGIYGSRSGNHKLRTVLRAYMAGFLTTRAEIAAMYALDFKGAILQAGDITLEITPKDAPDAYGAWWISLYNKRKLADARLDDTAYARLVRPVSEVIDKHGHVISGGWSEKEAGHSEKLHKTGKSARVLLRGFYRDKNGDFRLITEPSEPKANEPRS